MIKGGVGNHKQRSTEHLPTLWLDESKVITGSQKSKKAAEVEEWKHGKFRNKEKMSRKTKAEKM